MQAELDGSSFPNRGGRIITREECSSGASVTNTTASIQKQASSFGCLVRSETAPINSTAVSSKLTTTRASNTGLQCEDAPVVSFYVLSLVANCARTAADQ